MHILSSGRQENSITEDVCCYAMLQLVFAVVSPGAVVPNLVAGAIAEAGAQQAGDLMQVRPVKPAVRT